MAVFGLQFSEILIILVLALILLGPKKLPQIAKSLARGLKEVRRASQDLKDVWENEVEQTAGPELRALRNLRDPGSLVDSAWEATGTASGTASGTDEAEPGAESSDATPASAEGEADRATESSKRPEADPSPSEKDGT